MKYEYGKALNELKRRGLKTQKPLSYNQMMKKLNSTFAVIKNEYKGYVSFDKAGSVLDAMNDKKIKASQKRSLLSNIGRMHDEQKLSYREIIYNITKISVVPGKENSKPVQKFNQSALKALSKDKKLNLEKDKEIKSPKNIVKNVERRLRQQGYKFKNDNMANLSNYYLKKSLSHLTGDLETLVNVSIAVLGASYFSNKMQSSLNNWGDSNNNVLIAVVLSSDEEEMYSQREKFNDFFEFDKVYSSIKDDEKINGLTKKEIGDLLSKYGFAEDSIDPSSFSDDNLADEIINNTDKFIFHK